MLAFAAPGPTLAALIFVFAAYAIFDGVLATALGLAAPAGPRWLLVVGGIIGIAIGAYTLVNPQVTAVALVLLIGPFAIVRGVAEVGTRSGSATSSRAHGCTSSAGVVSIVFGAYLIVAPGDGALAVLFVIGFYALFAGVMYIAMGLQLRDVNKTLHSTATSASTAS